METAELAIRLQRAAFNRALSEANLAAIAPLLAQDVILVAGTDSSVLSGRKAQLRAWKHEFAAADRTIYARLPQTVEVSPLAPIAMEHGRWDAASLSGRSLAFGTYAAKWRKTGDSWVIEAEIFLTLG